MFQPQTKFSSSKSQKPSTLPTSGKKPMKEKVYPTDAGPISKLKGDVIAIDTRPTQIMSVVKTKKNVSIYLSNIAFWF